MSFTYNVTTDIGKVRLALGDNVEGSGVRPDGTNFEDEELSVFLTQAENDIDGATALALESLSRSWSLVPDLTLGPLKEAYSSVARSLAYRAKDLQERSGAETGGQPFSVNFVRDDGWAQDAESTDAE
jgi:hypothetical protein